MEKIEKGCGNVYADLGFPNAEEMFIKATLVTKIAEIIESRGWTQTQAAEVIGMKQPKLSKMLNGQFRGISEAKMLDCLARLGRNVHIVIDAESEAAVGHVDVVFA
jgi:predicted XRE-type DNA-binding protein